MSWMRLDDGVMGHEKIAGLSDSAFRLWMAGLAHCCQQGNDGVFSKSLVRVLFGYLQRPNFGPKSLKELLDAGLWIDEGACYHVHDFLMYQKSKEERASANLAASERMRKMRQAKQAAKGRCYAVTPGEHDANFARSYSDVTSDVRSSRSRPDPDPVFQNLSNLSVSAKSGGTAEPSQPDLPLQPQQAAVDVDDGQVHKSQPEATGQAKASHAIPKPQVAKQIALTLFGELQAARKRCNPNIRLDCKIKNATDGIERCLKDGATPDDIRHVIACWEALVKTGARRMQDFDHMTPFAPSKVGKYLMMTLEDAAKPRVTFGKPEVSPPKPAPKPKQPDEFLLRVKAHEEEVRKAKEAQNKS